MVAAEVAAAELLRRMVSTVAAEECRLLRCTRAHPLPRSLDHRWFQRRLAMRGDAR